ncbi:hypothetical protein CDAR_231411 [Caerostris darwini]|uniref:Uncharacterized protein n=1 Tax=Caerostris darwini TaxID=1538125 RepID=A0AAV4PJF9_9ARAC|nr:hypothetical protein CDAR_231411 [Caerostris darwini]
MITPTDEYSYTTQSCINNHNHELSKRMASPATKQNDFITPRKRLVNRNPQCTSSVKTARPISKENKFIPLVEKHLIQDEEHPLPCHLSEYVQ